MLAVTWHVPAEVNDSTPVVDSTVQPVTPALAIEYVTVPVPDDVALVFGVSVPSGALAVVFVGAHVIELAHAPFSGIEPLTDGVLTPALTLIDVRVRLLDVFPNHTDPYWVTRNVLKLTL